ncbi:MAG: hypothetical protein ABL973_04890 [Micropepsaceae bacterium]
MRLEAVAAILASSTILSGCAGTIAGVSLSSINSFAGFASTLFTGADLGEHVASLVTGKDCRFSEGLVREDRNICEEPGSAATRDDFHGIFVERIEADGTVVYAAPKYMPASVGAGENENNTDVVWAQIKAQKAVEENERQLARAENSQQIDVAALASGSLSSNSLGFLPIGFTATASVQDEEPASQTAARPRDFTNTKQSVDPRTTAKTAQVPHSNESDPPAIDEKSFTASMQIATATGEGGPFIAAFSNSTPVVSTLVNGEPVLVMRIGPVMSAAPISAPADHVAAMPIESPALETPSMVAQVTEAPAEPASPQALISSLPKAPRTMSADLIAEQAPIAPVKPAPKPKVKPAPVQVATVAPEKPAKAKPAPAPTIQTEDDVYQPPTSDVFSSPAPDLTSAPAAPAAEPASRPAPESTPSATNSPAPLIPMAQP